MSETQERVHIEDGPKRVRTYLGGELIADTKRLVTLTAVGGAGKTRLALEVAAQTVGDYSDGAWFADLTPLKDMALLQFICAGRRVSDLTPLKGMLLVDVGMESTQVADLTPLKDMPLSELICNAIQPPASSGQGIDRRDEAEHRDQHLDEREAGRTGGATARAGTRADHGGEQSWEPLPSAMAVRPWEFRHT